MGLLGFENIVLYFTKQTVTLGLCYNSTVAIINPLSSLIKGRQILVVSMIPIL